MFETTNQYRFSMMRCHSWPFTSPWPSFRAQGTLLPHPPWCRDYAIFGRCFGLEFGVVSNQKRAIESAGINKIMIPMCLDLGIWQRKGHQSHQYTTGISDSWLSWLKLRRFSDFSSGNFNVWAQMAARPCWRWKVTATKGNHRWPSSMAITKPSIDQ